MVSVNTSNLGSLQGMPDVEFDFGVSAELKRVFRAAATALSGQRGARQGYRTDGGTDFEGHFSQVFATNGTVQIGDLDEIVTNLRLVATKVAGVEEEPRAENERRRKAREWASMMANRGELEKLWHGLVGEPDPPVTEVGPTHHTCSSKVNLHPLQQVQIHFRGATVGRRGSRTATPQAVSVSAPTSARDTPTPSTGGGAGRPQRDRPSCAPSRRTRATARSRRRSSTTTRTVTTSRT